MAFEMVESFPGMLVGRGVDTTLGDTKSSIAVTGPVGIPAGESGKQGGIDFQQINTVEDFDKAINISASVSYGVSLFGASLGASAKASYRDQCKLSTQATFCVVRFVIQNALETFLDTPQLSEEAFELLKLGKTERFRERFGNRYISGRFTGGEFFATIRIESATEERQREIAASVEANFGTFAMEGSAEHVKIETSSEDKIEIHVMQIGGEIKPVFTFSEVLEHSLLVAQQIQSGQAVPFKVTLERYEELKLPTDNLSFVEHQHAQETLKQLAKDYRQLQVLHNDVQFVLLHQGSYVQPNIKQLNDANALIADMLNKIVDAADTCVRDVAKCEAIAVEIPKIELPKRKQSSKPPKPPKPPKPTGGLKPKFAASAGAGAQGPKTLNVGHALDEGGLAAIAAMAIKQRAKDK
jgi:hypothetical protein